MIYWLMKIILYIPFSILFPCIMKGKKKIPKGKAIVVCNHKSNVDYIYIWNRIWRKQFVLSKDSLYKNWLTRWFFKSNGGIAVNRDKVGISTIKESIAVLKKDKILTIFPEGTRNKTNEPLLEFKAGASVFAVKTNAPVIPMFILKKGGFFKFNKVLVGEPIYFDETFKGEDGTLKANEIIREKMLALKDKYYNRKKSNKWEGWILLHQNVLQIILELIYYKE